MKPILPHRLRKGDLIGIVSPASPIADAEKMQKGIRYLESLGYRTTIGTSVGKVHGYLAGTDEERRDDLHEMFTNPEVKAIICLRGGYGTPRLLSLLNYRLIKRNPKIVVGFSDVTALQFALWKKCGLVTFHGPMAGVEMASEMDPFTEEMFWRTVTSTKRFGKVTLPESIVLKKGIAAGRLFGGNLSLVVSLLGTQYQPDLTNAVLFLEEIGEEPYRVDRMLMQIRNTSLFPKIAGLLLGQFTDCIPSDTTKPSLTVDEILTDMAAHTHGPTLANLPFGHVSRKLTLPIGIRVQMHGPQQTIEFMESAVS